MSIYQLPPTRVAQLHRAGARLLPKIHTIAALAACWPIACACHAQTKSLAARVANALIAREPAATWSESTGTELEALDAEWYNTADGNYFRYVKRTVDVYLAANSAHNLQDKPAEASSLGLQLLLMHRITLAPNYYEAASTLRRTLAGACGLSSAENHADPELSSDRCTAAPFLAEYASVFHQPQDFAGITQGLLRWNDMVRQQARGDAASMKDGDASRVRLAAALVDAIPYFPADDAGRTQLVAVLNQIAASIAKHPESKAAAVHTARPSLVACLNVYALLKGVRLGLISEHYSSIAERAWHGVAASSVQENADGTIRLGHSSMSSTATATEAGAGELLLAATEFELAPQAALGRGKTVMLDGWYNSQQRTNAAGQPESFHYKWSDFSDSGYSLLGHLFESYGAATDMLYSAPTRETLARAKYYLIVSPDIPVKNPNPHYMSDAEAGEIAAWVHDGGVLILMENDPPNADISHLNLLANKFGLHFDDVLHHHILGDHVEDGRIPVAAGGPLFQQKHVLYMKDTCAISLHGAGTALLTDRGDIVMASVKYGQGMVFAAVDPWLYNEYTDGRKNPQIYNHFDNFAGGRELVRWLLEQHPHAKIESRKKQGQ